MTSTNYFDDTGLFESDSVYVTLDPIGQNMLATVIAECQLPLVGDGSGAVVLELGYGATDDHTAVTTGLTGSQAFEVVGKLHLHDKCILHQVLPANQFATFKMTTFPKGSVNGSFVRMTILRVPI